MTWPTSEQFDLAHQHGTEYALNEAANGATEPRESPLSGEWADDLTSTQVAANVGYAVMHEDDEGQDELADAWERGYNDAWAHSIGEQTT